jgi:hypothetical protein
MSLNEGLSSRIMDLEQELAQTTDRTVKAETQLASVAAELLTMRDRPGSRREAAAQLSTKHSPRTFPKSVP